MRHDTLLHHDLRVIASSFEYSARILAATYPQVDVGQPWVGCGRHDKPEVTSMVAGAVQVARPTRCKAERHRNRERPTVGGESGELRAAHSRA